MKIQIPNEDYKILNKQSPCIACMRNNSCSYPCEILIQRYGAITTILKKYIFVRTQSEESEKKHARKLGENTSEYYRRS